MPLVLGSVGIAGAVAGSAAGAAMVRWPSGGTLREPGRSVCDACGARLEARDLVPIVSWLVLRGRCRACGDGIDPRLPLLEVASVALAVGIVHIHGVNLTALALTGGAVFVLLAAVIDADHLMVPDRLTRPLAVLSLLALPVVAGRERAVGVALWAIGIPSVLRLVAAAADLMGRERPVGGGDIKLLVGVLALAGVAPLGPPAVLLVAVVLAGSHAVIGLVTGRLTRRSRLPFAPPLAVASLIVTVAPDRARDVVMIVGGQPWFV